MSIMSGIEHPRHPTLTLWIVAAVTAVALHAGGFALALASMQQQESDDLGASAIEVGVELLTIRSDPNDLPVGPDTQAAAMSPAVVQQKVEVKQSDLPKAKPTETDDPDRAVALNSTKKPNEDIKTPATPTAPSQESVAAEETAMPSLKTAAVSPRSTAPALGTGESARRDRITWQKELAAHLNKFKRYPADRAMQKAEVVVSFVLDRLGHVLSERIVRGSGDPSFDAEAIQMLERSNPVPAPPPTVADDGLTFNLPVIFHTKDDAADHDAGK
jgi:periplasmic protein TonB